MTTLLSRRRRKIDKTKKKCVTAVTMRRKRSYKPKKKYKSVNNKYGGTKCVLYEGPTSYLDAAAVQFIIEKLGKKIVISNLPYKENIGGSFLTIDETLKYKDLLLKLAELFNKPQIKDPAYTDNVELIKTNVAKAQKICIRKDLETNQKLAHIIDIICSSMLQVLPKLREHNTLNIINDIKGYYTNTLLIEDRDTVKISPAYKNNRENLYNAITQCKAAYAAAPRQYLLDGINKLPAESISGHPHPHFKTFQKESTNIANFWSETARITDSDRDRGYLAEQLGKADASMQNIDNQIKGKCSIVVVLNHLEYGKIVYDCFYKNVEWSKIKQRLALIFIQALICWYETSDIDAEMRRQIIQKLGSFNIVEDLRGSKIGFKAEGINNEATAITDYTRFQEQLKALDAEIVNKLYAIYKNCTKFRLSQVHELYKKITEAPALSERPTNEEELNNLFPLMFLPNILQYNDDAKTLRLTNYLPILDDAADILGPEREIKIFNDKVSGEAKSNVFKAGGREISDIVTPKAKLNAIGDIAMYLKDYRPENKEDVNCNFFGMGFSGSGKTFNLIESSDGILKTVKRFAERLTLEEVTVLTASDEAIKFHEAGKLLHIGNFDSIIPNDPKQTNPERMKQELQSALATVTDPLPRLQSADAMTPDRLLELMNLQNRAKSMKLDQLGQQLFDFYTMGDQNPVNDDSCKKYIYHQSQYDRIEKILQAAQIIKSTPNNPKSSRGILQLSYNESTNINGKTINKKLQIFDLPGKESPKAIWETYILSSIYFPNKNYFKSDGSVNGQFVSPWESVFKDNDGNVKEHIINKLSEIQISVREGEQPRSLLKPNTEDTTDEDGNHYTLELDMEVAFYELFESFDGNIYSVVRGYKSPLLMVERSNEGEIPNSPEFPEICGAVSTDYFGIFKKRYGGFEYYYMLCIAALLYGVDNIQKSANLIKSDNEPFLLKIIKHWHGGEGNLADIIQKFQDSGYSIPTQRPKIYCAIHDNTYWAKDYGEDREKQQENAPTKHGGALPPSLHICVPKIDPNPYKYLDQLFGAFQPFYKPDLNYNDLGDVIKREYDSCFRILDLLPEDQDTDKDRDTAKKIVDMNYSNWTDTTSDNQMITAWPNYYTTNGAQIDLLNQEILNSRKSSKANSKEPSKVWPSPFRDAGEIDDENPLPDISKQEGLRKNTEHFTASFFSYRKYGVDKKPRARIDLCLNDVKSSLDAQTSIEEYASINLTETGSLQALEITKIMGSENYYTKDLFVPNNPCYLHCATDGLQSQIQQISEYHKTENTRSKKAIFNSIACAMTPPPNVIENFKGSGGSFAPLLGGGHNLTDKLLDGVSETYGKAVDTLHSSEELDNIFVTGTKISRNTCYATYDRTNAKKAEDALTYLSELGRGDNRPSQIVDHIREKYKDLTYIRPEAMPNQGKLQKDDFILPSHATFASLYKIKDSLSSTEGITPLVMFNSLALHNDIHPNHIKEPDDSKHDGRANCRNPYGYSATGSNIDYMALNAENSFDKYDKLPKPAATGPVIVETKSTTTLFIPTCIAANASGSEKTWTPTDQAKALAMFTSRKISQKKQQSGRITNQILTNGTTEILAYGPYHIHGFGPTTENGDGGVERPRAVERTRIKAYYSEHMDVDPFKVNPDTMEDLRNSEQNLMSIFASWMTTLIEGQFIAQVMIPCIQHYLEELPKIKLLTSVTNQEEVSSFDDINMKCINKFKTAKINVALVKKFLINPNNHLIWAKPKWSQAFGKLLRSGASNELGSTCLGVSVPSCHYKILYKPGVEYDEEIGVLASQLQKINVTSKETANYQAGLDWYNEHNVSHNIMQQMITKHMQSDTISALLSSRVGVNKFITDQKVHENITERPYRIIDRQYNSMISDLYNLTMKGKRELEMTTWVKNMLVESSGKHLIEAAQTIKENFKKPNNVLLGVCKLDCISLRSKLRLMWEANKDILEFSKSCAREAMNADNACELRYAREIPTTKIAPDEDETKKITYDGIKYASLRISKSDKVGQPATIVVQNEGDKQVLVNNPSQLTFCIYCEICTNIIKINNIRTTTSCSQCNTPYRCLVI